jgi:hypothetical protein
MDMQLKPFRQPDFRLETVDGEAMLYHPARTEMQYLNPTAALVWGLCDGTRSVGEIILLLQESYPEAREEIPSDVMAVLQEFKKNGCLVL